MYIFAQAKDLAEKWPSQDHHPGTWIPASALNQSCMWPQGCSHPLAPRVSILFSTKVQHNTKARGANQYIFVLGVKRSVDLFHCGWKFCLLKPPYILLSDIILQKVTNTFLIVSCEMVSPPSDHWSFVFGDYTEHFQWAHCQLLQSKSESFTGSSVYQKGCLSTCF